MDLGGRLRQLGLEDYEAAFRENKIDNTRCLPGGRHEGRARQFELRGLWDGGTLREQFARQAS